MIRRSWAQAASIEETLALWAASLREVKKRIRPLFGQERVARNAGLFLEGLLGDEQRKTGWMRAEAAGDPGPWRQQALLGRRDWDADALRAGKRAEIRVINVAVATAAKMATPVSGLRIADAAPMAIRAPNASTTPAPEPRSASKPASIRNCRPISLRLAPIAIRNPIS